MKDKQQIELTPEELDGLIHRLDAGTLNAKDHEVIGVSGGKKEPKMAA